MQEDNNLGEQLSSSDSGAFQDESSLEVVQEAGQSPVNNLPKPKRTRGRQFDPRKVRKIALFVVITLIVIVSVAGVIAVLSKSKSQKPDTNVVINTQTLDNGTLNKITSSESSEVKQLTISPSVLFKSDVTVQGSTKLAKELSVGGVVNLSDNLNVNKALVVGSAATVGGDLTVSGKVTAGSLSVGSVTISSINISGDLSFEGHIVPSGSPPIARTSTSSRGGSVVVSGNDTSGTITITVGVGSPSGGELAIVNFRAAFGTTPKVQLTPVNNASSALPYFVTRTANFFTINGGSSASIPAGTVYIFDYFVTQ